MEPKQAPRRTGPARKRRGGTVNQTAGERRIQPAAGQEVGMRETKPQTHRTVAARALEDAESPSTYPESSYSNDGASDGATATSMTGGAGPAAPPPPASAIDPPSIVGPQETPPLR